MVKHLKDAFLIIKLTLLSVFIQKYSSKYNIQFFAKQIHIPVSLKTFIYKMQQIKNQKTAVLKGIAVFFHLAFSSSLSTICIGNKLLYLVYALKQRAFQDLKIYRKYCFTPGCRSPPDLFVFESN